jgi:beta-galactosidase
MHAESVCEIVHLEGATALCVYAEDFYAGHAALSVNSFGKGQAFYHAARLGDSALDAFYAALIERHRLQRALSAPLPAGVTAQRRQSSEHDFIFLMSFATEPRQVELGDVKHESLLDDASAASVSGVLELPAFGVAVLRRARKSGS